MQLFKSFKEKRLRLMLDEYRLNTAAGEWITPLNPDNIEIEFRDCKGWICRLEGKTIVLNSNYESKDLFPYLIFELWHLKQERKSPLKYWFYMIFCPSKVQEPANEKGVIAYNWLLEKQNKQTKGGEHEKMYHHFGGDFIAGNHGRLRTQYRSFHNRNPCQRGT